MTVDNGGGISRQDILRMTTDIVAAFTSKNQTDPATLTGLIERVHGTLAALADGQADVRIEASARKPAVPVCRSVNPDYIVCLEDGRKLKMLKRHLRAAFNMTPEEYRTRWNLPKDYLMVAPNYAKKRSDFAKKMGLGKR